MNLSVKNMIFAFIAGLVVFSLLITALCVSMFNAEISVAKDQNSKPPQNIDTVNLDKAAVFCVVNEDNKKMDFFVLVMIDGSEKKVILTPVYGDYLIPYKNALSYVSTVYAELDQTMISETVRAFSGIWIDENDIHSVEKNINYESFKSNLFEIIEKNLNVSADWSSYTIDEFTVEIKENQTNNTHESIKQIDIEKNVEKFRTVLVKK